jgi:hypothetical protein
MKQFDSFAAFAAHLRVVALKVEVAEHLALHDAGRLVQETSQGYIGEYQPTEGPFPAWPDLAETTLQGFSDEHGHHPGKIELGFSPPDNPLKRTEDLKHAIELHVDSREAVVGVPDENAGDGSPESPFRNLGDVAVEQELGTINMPARSFLGRALFTQAHHIVDIIGVTVARAVADLPPVPASHNPTSDDPPF